MTELDTIEESVKFLKLKALRILVLLDAVPDPAHIREAKEISARLQLERNRLNQLIELYDP